MLDYIILNHRYSFSEEQLRIAIKENFSIAGTLRQLNLIVAGSNYRKINRLIKLLDISTLHWTGKGHLTGKHHNWSKFIPLTDILIKNSNYTCTNRLRKRLIKEHMLSANCSVCGLKTWLNKEITLHLDHINGDNEDNRIENLRLLCPNCHSQTPTYCGRNKGKNKMVA